MIQIPLERSRIGNLWLALRSPAWQSPRGSSTNALGLVGWVQARRTTPLFAHCVLFYAVLVTLLHIPFPMLTRLRIPFMDPLLAILGGGPVGVRMLTLLPGELQLDGSMLCEDPSQSPGHSV